MLVDVGLAEAVHRGREVDVLDTREVRMKPGADLEERSDASAHLQVPLRGREDVGHQLQERGLSGTVPPDDPECLARAYAEGHVAKRPHLVARMASRMDEHVLDRACAERAERKAPADSLGPDLASRDLGHAQSSTAISSS